MNNTNNIVISAQSLSKRFSLHSRRTLKEVLDSTIRTRTRAQLVNALYDVTFDIYRGEVVGIIGRNGAGKSTLLTLIAGASSPTSGTISIKGVIAPIIELGAGFHPDLTGRENIYLNGVLLGLREEYIRSNINEIIAFSELEKRFIEMPIKHYSSGMYMRLAFSVAVFTKPDILLIDEILAVGDTAFQKKCMKQMDTFKHENKTLLYVSHNVDVVKRFCSRILYLENGTLKYDGDPNKAVDMYLQDSYKEKDTQ